MWKICSNCQQEIGAACVARTRLNKIYCYFESQFSPYSFCPLKNAFKNDWALTGRPCYVQQFGRECDACHAPVDRRQQMVIELRHDVRSIWWSINVTIDWMIRPTRSTSLASIIYRYFCCRRTARTNLAPSSRTRSPPSPSSRRFWSIDLLIIF